MHAMFRTWARSSAGLIVPLLFLLAACSATPPPSSPPEAPAPPDGWTSLGTVRGESAPGWAVSRLTFSGRAAAVDVACQGSGTLFVIVGWTAVSPSSGPGLFQTAAFPCNSPIEGAMTSRIELTTAPKGTVDVNVFVVDGAGAIGRSSFGLSIEERAP
jgi:hypothetical protein